MTGSWGRRNGSSNRVAWEQRKRELTAGRSPEERESLARYESAQKLYEAGEYRQAEKAFKSIAKERRRSGLNWAERAADAFFRRSSRSSDPMFDQYGDPLEEDALFMIAESQFAQRKYSWAQDSYDLLLEKYPSSRHLDTVTRRLFRIAHAWMGFPDANDKGDVELASGELLKTNPRIGQPDFKKPSFFNVADRTRPLFDTSGRALQALQSIWLNDANGPLADDALMLTANYHLQTGDFVEAARVYQLLRDQYPDSSHFKDAYVLESHVRLAAYEGPAYDAKGLRESKELKENARQIFPDLTEQQRTMLDNELANIAIAEERRVWYLVQFYKSKEDETAVALYCNKILNQYPNSRFAKAAQRELEAIADRRRSQRGSFNMFGFGQDNQPVSPVLAGVGSPLASSAPGRAENSFEEGRASLSSGRPSTSKTPRQEPSFIRRFLRRAERDPKLEPVDRPPPTTGETTEGRANLLDSP